MGGTESKTIKTEKNCNLEETTNVCQISDCIDKIKGISSNSTSPTDIWIIDFKDGVTYKDKEIKKAILKIFADPKSLYEYTSIKMEKLNDIEGLNYELNIYKYVISKLIDFKICPNFIKYLSSGINCNYDDLINILNNHLENDDRKLTLEECQNSLNRNIEFLYKNNRNRPPIQLIGYPRYSYPNKNLTYNMIMNETSNGIKLTEWIHDYRSDLNFETELWNIMLQIAVGCYSMSLSKMVHNDLHSDNIFIEKYDSMKTINYYINNSPIVIKTNFKALIYDFDRSYCISLGKNPFLKREYCDFTSQCNKFIENKDIVKILCYVVTDINDHTIRLKLLKLLTKDKSDNNEIFQTYNETKGGFCFLQEIKYGKAISKPDSFYIKLNSNENVINTIKTYLINYLPDNNLDYTYFCNKNFFDSDGILRKDIIQKFYNDLNNTKVLIKSTEENKKISEKDIIKSEEERLSIDRINIEREKKILEKRILYEEREKEMKKKMEEEKRRIQEYETQKEKERLILEEKRKRLEKEKVRSYKHISIGKHY